MRTPAFVLALCLGLLMAGGTTAPTVVTATHSAESADLLASSVAANPVAAVVSPEVLTPQPPVTAEVRPGPAGLDPAALDAARRATSCATRAGALQASPLLAVIDYTLPSTQPRLWVWNRESGEVLFHERVAHGQGSGGDLASVFSDEEGSHQTSLGLFVTAETYTGKHGKSLRLDGLDPGWNGRARPRAIVVHGADYVSDDFVGRVGRLGRSWGCPAVSRAVSSRLIDTIAGGVPLFAWHGESDWESTSQLASCG